MCKPFFITGKHRPFNIRKLAGLYKEFSCFVALRKMDRDRRRKRAKALWISQKRATIRGNLDDSLEEVRHCNYFVDYMYRLLTRLMYWFITAHFFHIIGTAQGKKYQRR